MTIIYVVYASWLCTRCVIWGHYYFCLSWLAHVQTEFFLMTKIWIFFLRELLLDFYDSSNGCKSTQFIVVLSKVHKWRGWQPGLKGHVLILPVSLNTRARTILIGLHTHVEVQWWYGGSTVAGQGGVAHAELEFGATKMGNTDSNLRQRWVGWGWEEGEGKKGGRTDRGKRIIFSTLWGQ